MFNFLDTKLESFGIHISDNSIKVAKIKRTKKEAVLASFGSKKIESKLVEKGIIKEPELLIQNIVELTDNLIGEPLKTKYASVSLPEENSFFQIIEVPKMSEQELQKAIKYEAENYIPISIDQVYFDFQSIKERENAVLISATPKKIVDSNLSAIKEANFFPVFMENEASSIVRSVIKKAERNKAILSVNIGESKTIVTVFDNNSIRFSTFLPISSTNFKKKISENKNITILDAEVLLREYGILGAGKGREIYQLLKPSILEIIENIKKHISYYRYYELNQQEKSDHKQIEKVVVSGGGAKIKGLLDFFSNNLQVPVEKGSPFSNLSEKSRKIFDNNSDYEVAFGLALRDFEID